MLSRLILLVYYLYDKNQCLTFVPIIQILKQYSMLQFKKLESIVEAILSNIEVYWGKNEESVKRKDYHVRYDKVNDRFYIFCIPTKQRLNTIIYGYKEMIPTKEFNIKEYYY